MPLLFVEKITDTVAKVITEYRRGYEDLPEDVRATGIEVDQLPVRVYPRGKNEVMYINPQTKEVWLELEDRPLTQEEHIQEMKQQQLLMQQAIDDLILGGAL